MAKDYINYIVGPKTNAQQTIRKFLGYSGKKEIEENIHRIKGDMFFWLISKVYNGNINIEAGNKSEEITIEAIKGLRGKANNRQNIVSANGDGVMNMISTLSFLLEDREVTLMSLVIKYHQHERIKINIKNNDIVFDQKGYQGIYWKEDDKEIDSKIYLLLYLEIIPQIISCYETEKEEGQWNKKVKVDFLERVAYDLSKKVEEEIKKIKSR